MSPTQPSKTTVDEEHEEANSQHGADRPPTEEEARQADQAKSHMSAAEAHDVAEHYEEMSRLGANDQGEGRID